MNKVEVKQVDRDAAARVHAKRRGGRLLAANIRERYVDDDELVQAFARHRIAECASIVAWLREQADIDDFGCGKSAKDVLSFAAWMIECGEKMKS